MRCPIKHLSKQELSQYNQLDYLDVICDDTYGLGDLVTERQMGNLKRELLKQKWKLQNSKEFLESVKSK